MNYNRQNQINRLINYIKSGEKSPDEFKVGAEFENFLINKDATKIINYFDENGIIDILNDLSKELNLPLKKEGKFPLGLEFENLNISLEPGSQFELSINAEKNIEDLEKSYIKYINLIQNTLKKYNIDMISMGYNPISKALEEKILPKKRYDYMYNFFDKNNDMSHYMMKGSGSVQVSIDYKDEIDMQRKYKLASILSPILYTLFDNSPILEQKPYNKYNLRQKIWQATDYNRSGLLPISLNMTYENYANYILDMKPIFIPSKDGIKSTENQTVAEIFDPTNDSDELIAHVLSMVFPDIRIKTYLEIRMMDAVPYPLNFSIIALIKGIFYSDSNIELLLNHFANIKIEDILKAKDNDQIDSLNTKYLSATIQEHAQNLLTLSKNALDDNEKKYLKPLQKLIERNIVPKDTFNKIANKTNVQNAILSNRIEVN